MAKKDDGPAEYIKKHSKLHDKAKRLFNTAENTHIEAYNSGVKEVLTGKDGLINYDQLEEHKNQEKLANHMSDIYVAKAKQVLKVSGDLDEVEKDMLMNAYAGTTRSEIRELIKRQGKDLSHQAFTNEMNRRYLPQLQQRLYAAAGQHIQEEHVGGIVKHLGLEGKLKVEQIDIVEARNLLLQHEESGTISDQALRQTVPIYKHKKKKKEEDD